MVQLGEGLPKNNASTLHGKGRHNCSDYEVWPSARSEDAERCQ
jgi:hypothetical protein